METASDGFTSNGVKKKTKAASLTPNPPIETGKSAKRLIRGTVMQRIGKGILTLIDSDRA